MEQPGKDANRNHDEILVRAARARGQTFASGVSEMLNDGGFSDPNGFWARQIKERSKKVIGRPLKRGEYLATLQKEFSGLDGSKLNPREKGRYLAIKKHVSGKIQEMSNDQKLNLLSNDDEKMKVASLATSLFGVFGGDKERGGRLFDLASRATDDATRGDLIKSFKRRGLVSDVAADKGISWDKAAKGLGDLGLMSDARLRVTPEDINEKSKGKMPSMDTSEVHTGTAETSVLQLGRSLDEASASIGNRMNGNPLEKSKKAEALTPDAKASKQHDRAAAAEMAGLRLMKAGGKKDNVMILFAMAGASTRRGLDVRKDRSKEKIISGLQL